MAIKRKNRVSLGIELGPNDGQATWIAYASEDREDGTIVCAVRYVSRIGITSHTIAEARLPAGWAAYLRTDPELGLREWAAAKLRHIAEGWLWLADHRDPPRVPAKSENGDSPKAPRPNAGSRPKRGR